MNGLRKYMIISGIVLVGYLLLQYFRPKPTDWKPTYLKEHKIPFGTYILYQQLPQIFPAADVRISKRRIYSTLHDQKYRQANLLLIASKADVDKSDLKELREFVRAGNSVFIAAFDWSTTLKQFFSIRSTSGFDFSREKSTAIHFTNPNLNSKKHYVFDKGLGDQYFNKFDTVNAVVLGRNEEGNANFLRYRIGKGAFYLLPNPQLLTNYSLLNPDGADYAAKALSYLPKGKILIWDEYGTRGIVQDNSALRVIFGNEMLRWAYYLALIGLVIFVLYEMKRRQRIIPILEPLKNSSVDFVKVVSKVYYQQRDNNDIAIKKTEYLLEYIRSTYYLKTKVLDEELKMQLVARSGAKEETISQLLFVMERIRKGIHVDDHLLIRFNQLTEQFYQESQ